MAIDGDGKDWGWGYREEVERKGKNKRNKYLIKSGREIEIGKFLLVLTTNFVAKTI